MDHKRTPGRRAGWAAAKRVDFNLQIMRTTQNFAYAWTVGHDDGNVGLGGGKAREETGKYPRRLVQSRI